MCLSKHSFLFQYIQNNQPKLFIPNKNDQNRCFQMG